MSGRSPLTATGLAFALGGTVAVALGVLSGRAGITGLGAAALAALFIGGLTIAATARLGVERLTDQHSVTAGEPVTVTLRLSNRSRVLTADVDAHDEVRQDGALRRAPIAVPVLLKGGSRELNYHVPTQTRGIITLGPLTFRCADGLGLLSRQVQVGSSATVLVRPRVTPIEAATRGGVSALDGINRDGTPTSSGAFHSLRPYVSGDDPRSVHWRSSARRGELVVRQLVDVVQPRLTIVLDRRASSYAALPGRVMLAFELAVETVASLVAASVQRGVPCEVALGSEQVSSVADLSQVDDVLDALAATALGGDRELPDAAPVTPGSAMIVVSGCAAVDFTGVDELARRHEAVLVLILDAVDDPALDGRQSQHGSGPVLAKARVERVDSVAQALLAWQRWGGR